MDIHEHHDILYKGFASPANDPKKGGDERQAEEGGEEGSLDVVGDPEADRLLVEAMFLFQDEGFVEARWDGGEHAGEGEQADEEHGGGDLAGADVERLGSHL